MLRPAAALLLLASAVVSYADDPILPMLPNVSAEPTPIADPGPSLGTPVHSQPTISQPSDMDMGTSISPQPESTSANVSEYPVMSMPQPSAPVMSYSPSPVAASGCGCSANVYSGSSLGVAVGFQAMGYHGGGMETYTGAEASGMHVRHPYYSYRRPWYANGPMSQNMTIAW